MSSLQAGALLREQVSHEFASITTSDLDRQLAAILACVSYLDAGGDASHGDELRRLFDQFVHSFDHTARVLGDEDAARLGQHVQSALLPLMRRSENGYRWFSKPRGYAGDYQTIARMYDDATRGAGVVDKLLDRCFLRLPAVAAVQNRRALMSAEIKATLREVHDQWVRVTSFACGPARELFDLYAHLDEPRAVQSTLVDFDAEALTYCGHWARQLRVENAVQVIEANLIHAAVGRAPLELPPQDLVYSIGLIDYFNDELVIKLMNLAHKLLRPKGRIILGNFHPRNPTRAVMDHVLDWKLIHRTEEDMHRLYRASSFNRPCTRIMYEAQQINLFAECVK